MVTDPDIQVTLLRKGETTGASHNVEGEDLVANDGARQTELLGIGVGCLNGLVIGSVVGDPAGCAIGGIAWQHRIVDMKQQWEQGDKLLLVRLEGGDHFVQACRIDVKKALTQGAEIQIFDGKVIYHGVVMPPMKLFL